MSLIIHFDLTELDGSDFGRSPVGVRVRNDTLGRWYDPATGKLRDDGLIPRDCVPLVPIGDGLADDPANPPTDSRPHVDTLYPHLVRAEIPTPVAEWGRSAVALVTFHRLAFPEGQAPGGSGFLCSELVRLEDPDAGKPKARPRPGVTGKVT